MRQFIIGITILVITILVTMVIWLQGEHQIRQEELRTAINRGMKQTMQQYVAQCNSGENCTDQWMKEVFIERFLVQIQNKSDLEICFYTADSEKGLLDIEIAETYRTIIGVYKTIKVRKTLICQ